MVYIISVTSLSPAVFCRTENRTFLISELIGGGQSDRRPFFQIVLLQLFHRSRRLICSKYEACLRGLERCLNWEPFATDWDKWRFTSRLTWTQFQDCGRFLDCRTRPIIMCCCCLLSQWKPDIALLRCGLKIRERPTTDKDFDRFVLILL